MNAQTEGKVREAVQREQAALRAVRQMQAALWGVAGAANGEGSGFGAELERVLEGLEAREAELTASVDLAREVLGG